MENNERRPSSEDDNYSVRRANKGALDGTKMLFKGAFNVLLAIGIYTYKFFVWAGKAWLSWMKSMEKKARK